MAITGDGAAEMTKKFAVLAEEAAESGKLNALLAAPVIETLFFLVAFKTLEVLQIARQRRTAVLAMALTMGTVDWLLHDVRDSIVAQSFGFAALGALFAVLWFQSGSIIAFAGTALAHMIWNVSLLVLALTYVPHFVWESTVQYAVSDGTRTDFVGDFETVGRCRQMGLLHLQRLQAGRSAQQQEKEQGGIKCERAIRFTR